MMSTLELPNTHLSGFGDWVMLAAGKNKRRPDVARKLCEQLFGDGPEARCEVGLGDTPFFDEAQWTALRVAVETPREWFVRTVMPRFYQLIDWRDASDDDSEDPFTGLDGELMLLLIAMNELLAPHQLRIAVEDLTLPALPDTAA